MLYRKELIKMTRKTSSYAQAERLLKRKKLTGKEAGQLWIADLAHFRENNVDLFDQMTAKKALFEKYQSSEVSNKDENDFREYLTIATLLDKMYSRASIFYLQCINILDTYSRDLENASSHEIFLLHPKIMPPTDFISHQDEDIARIRLKHGMTAIFDEVNLTIKYIPTGLNIVDLANNLHFKTNVLGYLSNTINYLTLYNSVLKALNETYDLICSEALNLNYLDKIEEQLEKLNDIGSNLDFLVRLCPDDNLEAKLEAFNNVFEHLESQRHAKEELTFQLFIKHMEDSAHSEKALAILPNIDISIFTSMVNENEKG